MSSRTAVAEPRLLPLLALLALAFPATTAAQEPSGVKMRTDVLTGTITTDSAAPIHGADVIATRAPDRTSFATKTNELGRYRLEIREGTGDYLIYVSAVGRKPWRRRLTRTSEDSVLTLDLALPLAGTGQELAAVEVKGRRRVISREAATDSEAGARQESPPGIYGAVPPDLEGNVDAWAATTPGVTPVTGGGFSVLGLNSSENSSTLNGMAFNGSDVPREAKTKATVTTSTYDPARGWFSGAEVAITLRPGGVFSFRRSHLTMDAPYLQLPDVYAQRRGGRFTNGQLSVGGDGALTQDDRYVYSYALQGSFGTEPITSLWESGENIARFTGTSPDSARALLDRLSAAGVPITSPSGRSRQKKNMSFIGRFDHAPYDWKTFTPSRTMWGLLAYGKLAESGAVGVRPTTTAAYGGMTTRATGMLQALYSSYDSTGALTELRSGMTLSRVASVGYFALPSGDILLSSLDSVGAVDAVLFHFGNDPTLGDLTRRWTWETSGDKQMLMGRRQQHRLKISSDLRIDGQLERDAEDRFGRFSFFSLADLAANSPSAFTRTRGTLTRAGRVANAFLAFGDDWRITDKLRLMYGARLEGNRFLVIPPPLPEVERAFNVSTTQVHNVVSLSPRVGFTWVRHGSGAGIRVSPVGLFSIGPSSYLTGGIGRFRGLVHPTITLGSQIARINCVGPAAPPPDWIAYSGDINRIPNECLSGAPPDFATDAVDVEFLKPSYRSPGSWRGNLAYASQWSRLAFSLEGVYSLNLDQPSRVDLNFRNVPGFRLATEAGRPIYVPVSAIDVRSGLLAPGPSRQDTNFGRVDAVLSDSRSISRQLTFRLSPQLETLGNWYASLAYTLSSARQLQRGYVASTFDSPLAREWSAIDFLRRHQMLLQGGVGSSKVSLTFFGVLASGALFTPLISSDINGDGRRNDRAFIFDPTKASDPELASGIQALLTAGPRRIRNCLTRQLNRPAGRNSCTGPWSASLNAQVRASGRTLRLGDRTNVALSISNPLGGLDQILHGSRGLRGWGTRSAPDPILFRVQSFDAITSSFHYNVNNDFGSTERSNAALRVPFRITLDVSIDIGRPVPVQQLQKWLSPGRAGQPGPRLTAEEIKRRYRRNVLDPYAQILAESDSLLLSPGQVDSLVTVQADYNARVDSIWTSLATYLGNLGDRYDGRDALRRAEAATDEVWELTRADIQRRLPGILNPIQLQLMPVAGLYNSRGPIPGRTYSYE